ncbi:hypothetical protein [Lacticaseibacillus songhuajiangensis]|jgi:D-ribose pyranose/furanose isomerase RbsD|uniref:hypothetical protein n=1 Tax=Lacticaseibacillus songhuajiangensis TaxID=1296539 RepID=UPI000F7871C8|nr:hypothetical protein [Lacticaseibacillus songhuajiangensis]
MHLKKYVMVLGLLLVFELTACGKFTKTLVSKVQDNGVMYDISINSENAKISMRVAFKKNHQAEVKMITSGQDNANNGESNEALISGRYVRKNNVVTLKPNWAAEKDNSNQNAVAGYTNFENVSDRASELKFKIKNGRMIPVGLEKGEHAHSTKQKQNTLESVQQDYKHQVERSLNSYDFQGNTETNDDKVSNTDLYLKNGRFVFANEVQQLSDESTIHNLALARGTYEVNAKTQTVKLIFTTRGQMYHDIQSKADMTESQTPFPKKMTLHVGNYLSGPRIFLEKYGEALQYTPSKSFSSDLSSIYRKYHNKMN